MDIIYSDPDNGYVEIIGNSIDLDEEHEGLIIEDDTTWVPGAYDA